MGEFWRRIVYLLNRRRIECELELEMQSHRAEMHDPSTFGSTLKLREEANDAWGFAWFDHLCQDIHYALRTLRHSPAFTATAIAVLAIGIGLNVTAFGFLNSAMFRPLPGIEDPHTLMRLTRRWPHGNGSNVSYPAYDFYRRNNKGFESLIAVSEVELTYLDSERWKSQLVSRNYFSELGVLPAYGRVEVREPGDLILSSGFFERRFAGDTSVIGKSIQLNRNAARIVGVAASGFQGLNPEGADAWGLLEDHPHFFAESALLNSTSMQPLHLFGRLRSGLSPIAAEAAMRPIVAARRQLAAEEIFAGEFLQVEPGAYVITKSEKLFAPLLIASTLLLLVLATSCANLGNLLLARSISRQRELSIRKSLGATRGRIVRQLMTESIILALLGATVGLGLSTFASSLIVRALDWPSFVDVAPDWRVVAFAFGAGLLASLFFGLAPALAATRVHAQRTARLRLSLVAAQAAACCILLIVSGLLTRGLFKAVSESPGFSYQQSLVVDPDLEGVGRQGQSARLYFDQLQSAMSQSKGVEATALATIPPLGQTKSTIASPVGRLLLNSIGDTYFDTMQIPLLRGRAFRPGDRDVTILGERAAARLWPNEIPLGKEFTTPDGKLRRLVIGIAANAPIYAPEDSDAMEIYFPIAESDLSHAVLLVRTTRLDETFKSLYQSANRIDSRIIPNLWPMRDGMARRLSNTRATAITVALLGAVSLSLAVVGFAGLISFAVTQRTREIGIRLALGAGRWQVIQISLDRLLLPTLLGLAIGMAIAAALAVFIRSQLYGISSIDPISFLAAPALFLLCAFVFSLVPLNRAAGIDPSTALRHE